MNDRIRSPQVRLVGADGSQIGIVSTQEALRQAQELDLDLVEVAPQANPPVARIMDYGKFKYERDIRQKEARKKQVRVEVKEIKFRPKIDRHDYDTKKGHVVRFLSAGARVKVTIMFRGREMAHTDLGRKILDRLVEDLGDTAVVEAQPKQDGRNMVMVIGPTKKAMEQRTEASKRGLEPPAAAPSPEPVEDATAPKPAEETEAPVAEQEASGAREQSQAQGSVEGPQPATR
ncbi:MAG: translation initiation factor IF-3 [Actinomycetota bacterium]